MKCLMFSFLLILFSVNIAKANQYTELAEFAKQVPHSEIDREVFDYIANETNESLEGIKSHYTLALFENTIAHRSWYILDGYYELKSGKILFLDFNYNPKTKTWWPIENYRFYLPGVSQRYLLEAEKICNPYQRHFIGIVSTSLNSVNLSQIQKFFDEKHQRQPMFFLNDTELTIIDPTKSAQMAKKVIFTLHENDLISKLLAIGARATVISSGRAESTPELKKTYVASTPSCESNNPVFSHSPPQGL